MRIGAHVDSADPLAAAAARGAEVIQFFLTDPQSYAAPEAARRRRALRGARPVDIYIHSPYRLNVATHQQPHPHPQPQAAAAARRRPRPTIGAKGLIVHGGHVDQGADMDVGFDNWRKTFATRPRTAASRCRS